MEGKTVILSVLIISLVMAQIQVEAKTCCPNAAARNFYNSCRRTRPISFCIRLFPRPCRIFPSGRPCPPRFPFSTVDNFGDASVNEYCNLGCTSSVCGDLTTLQNSDASEIMNEEVEQCTKECSTLCTEGIKTVLETA